jgi:hypothetical protein
VQRLHGWSAWGEWSGGESGCTRLLSDITGASENLSRLATSTRPGRVSDSSQWPARPQIAVGAGLAICTQGWALVSVASFQAAIQHYSMPRWYLTSRHTVVKRQLIAHMAGLSWPADNASNFQSHNGCSCAGQQRSVNVEIPANSQRAWGRSPVAALCRAKASKGAPTPAQNCSVSRRPGVCRAYGRSKQHQTARQVAVGHQCLNTGVAIRSVRAPCCCATKRSGGPAQQVAQSSSHATVGRRASSLRRVLQSFPDGGDCVKCRSLGWDAAWPAVA